MTILFEDVLYLSAGPGATTKRKPKDRAADVRNVLDFGADPTGVTDSSAAFQAAVNASGVGTSTPTIYMPKGYYLLNTSINLSGAAVGPLPQFGFIFRGEGFGTILVRGGGGAGFILDRSVAGAAGQFGLFGFENFQIINSVVGGGGIRMNTAMVGYVRNCYIQCDLGLVCNDNSFFINCHDSFFSNTTGSTTASIGIDGAQMLISGCQFQGMGIGIKVEFGLTIIGCRFEENSIGVQVTNSSGGTSIIGCQNEANGIDIDLLNCSGVLIANTSGAGRPSQEVLDGNAYSLSGISFTGSNDRITVTNCRFFASYQRASIDTPNPGNPNTDVVFINVETENLGAAPGGSTARWVLPTNPSTWEFIRADMNLGASGQAVTFANLPSPAYVGWKAWINNSNTTTFGATIAGGGANLVQGQYNGTNWKVIAI